MSPSNLTISFGPTRAPYPETTEGVEVGIPWMQVVGSRPKTYFGHPFLGAVLSKLVLPSPHQGTLGQAVEIYIFLHNYLPKPGVLKGL